MHRSMWSSVPRQFLQPLMRLRDSAISCWYTVCGGYRGMHDSLSSTNRWLSGSNKAFWISRRSAFMRPGCPQPVGMKLKISNSAKALTVFAGLPDSSRWPPEWMYSEKSCNPDMSSQSACQ